MAPHEHSWLENSQLVLQSLRRLDEDIKAQDARIDKRHDDNLDEQKATRGEISALRTEIAELKQKVRGQASVIAFLVALATSIITGLVAALIGKH